MILLFGGTTEAKTVADCLEEAGKEYIYSTKTKVGFQGNGIYRFGPLTQKELEAFCLDKQISCIINASHPFAMELHHTVAALALDIPLIRFERSFPARFLHPLVTYLTGYEEALKLLEEQQAASLLTLTGVQSIPRLSPFWKRKKAWFRILKREESEAFAAQHDFPKEDLYFGFPQEKEKEEAFFRSLNPAAILTKESGHNGKLQDKIDAAIACRIPILIIEKPLVSPRYQLVQNCEELLNLLPHE